MGTVSDLVAEIQGAGGFDVTATDALTVLDRRHKQMCRRARWHRKTTTVAATTATDATYSTIAPVGLVEAFAVQAARSGSVIGFQRTREGDRGAIMGGTLRMLNAAGVFLENDEDDPSDTTPDTSLVLYPALDDATVVTVRGAFEPPTLTTSEATGAFIRVPVDFHDGLLQGVYASILNRPGEARPDLAATAESAFAAACAELRDLADRRYRTRGPKQVRIGGIDA